MDLGVVLILQAGCETADKERVLQQWTKDQLQVSMEQMVFRAPISR